MSESTNVARKKLGEYLLEAGITSLSVTPAALGSVKHAVSAHGR